MQGRADNIRLSGQGTGPIRHLGQRVTATCLRALSVALLTLVLAACALNAREDFSATEQEVAAMPGFGAVRVWGDAPAREIARTLLPPALRPGPNHDVNLLAISGGGAGGAFTAGLLDGWTRSGRRPSFDIVTGVSTGALIAPFAFLGPAYDATLKTLYTGGGSATVAEPQNIFKIAAGEGLVDPEPLKRLVASYVTPEFLAAIAAEHRRGRRLLVLTTNLDAQRPVVWNMGAIAASDRPDAAALFRGILVASASVPAVFPPVMIRAESGGRPITEMHVDGVATKQIFVRPDMMLAAGAAVPEALRKHIHLWAVVNNTLPPEFAVTAPGTLSIAYRALATVMKAQAGAQVTDAYEQATRLGLDFELAYIDHAVTYDPAAPFASAYMDAVYAIGDREAVDGRVWHKTPDGLAVPAPK